MEETSLFFADLSSRTELELMNYQNFHLKAEHINLLRKN